MLAELARRGIDAREVQRKPRSVELQIDADGSARSREIVVKVKTVGEWHTDTQLGEARAEDPDETRLWVLVDIGQDPAAAPDYYIVPEWWMLDYINTEYTNHLEKHGGTRPRTPESRHCAIHPDHVERWRDRWDLVADGSS